VLATVFTHTHRGDRLCGNLDYAEPKEGGKGGKGGKDGRQEASEDP